MPKKRYMNDEGKIVSNPYEIYCPIGIGASCKNCKNSKANNPTGQYCSDYFSHYPGAYMNNLGYREIFELENYTDSDYVMVCQNGEESEIFARFLDKNGRTWCDGRTYIDDRYWRTNHKYGTIFVFNKGVQVTQLYCNDAGYKKLNFSDYIFKTEDKKMETKPKNLLFTGCLLEDNEGTHYIAMDSKGEGMWLLEDDGSGNKLSTYDDDLVFDAMNDCYYTIKKIWGLPAGHHVSNFSDLFDPHMLDRKLIWERAIPMTLNQIEKKLGFKIKLKEE